jgi:hypothetical protein
LNQLLYDNLEGLQEIFELAKIMPTEQFTLMGILGQLKKKVQADDKGSLQPALKKGNFTV